MSLWTLTSFSQGLFSTFSDRKARCLSASFSASEATVRVMQTCLSRPRWQWEEGRDGGWVGGVGPESEREEEGGEETPTAKPYRLPPGRRQWGGGEEMM